MAMYRGSFQSSGGTFLDPDFVYYNASIINNSTTVTDATGQYVLRDPAVRFNETRDKEILQNAGEYYFSILRVQLNGTGRDLPLFIPTIQTGGGKADVNKTTYGMAFSYSQDISGSELVNGPGRVTVAPPVRFVIYKPETNNEALAPTPSATQMATTGIQDISTRYYWVYSYQNWLDSVNRTILNPADLDGGNGYPFTCCWGDTYQALVTAEPEFGRLFPTLRSFNDYVNAPQITYAPDTNRFSVWGDSDGFGPRLTNFTVVTPTNPMDPFLTSRPTARMFMNSNMFGLFANLPNQYWNSRFSVDNPFVTTPLSNGAAVPEEYVNEITFSNKFYSNVVDYRIPPGAGVPPLGYVPIGAQKPYYVMEQEYPSSDSLWSPIESLVITSNLLSIAPEYTSPPVQLGTGNNVFSSPTVPSAFEPIISDLMVDSSLTGSGINRQFILFEPKAEYRLADFTTKGTAVRNIDIQIYWRCRLNGTLYPLQMFNLASVSIKAMFKHRSLNGGKGNW